jgi:hypothetical protein
VRVRVELETLGVRETPNAFRGRLAVEVGVQSPPRYISAVAVQLHLSVTSTGTASPLKSASPTTPLRRAMSTSYADIKVCLGRAT